MSILITVSGLATAQSTSGPAASAPAHTASSRVVLKVGSVQLTEDEFEAGIRGFESDKDAPPISNRQKLGEDYASALMLSQQAVADHLETDADVRRQLEIARTQVLSDAEFANLMRQAQPSPEEVSAYYSAHQGDYDEAHIRRLFIWKTRDNSKDGKVLSTQEARAYFETIRQALLAGKDVKTVAQELKDSGAGQLDVEPLTFPRGELPPHMEKIAFGLDKGSWGVVEDTHDSLMVVQLVNLNRRPLAEVSSVIRKQLQADKMQAKLDELKKKAGIWMDEQYFGIAAAPARAAMTSASSPQPKLQNSAAGKKENENEGEAQK